MEKDKATTGFGFVGRVLTGKDGRFFIYLPTSTLQKRGWEAGDYIHIRVQGVRGSLGEVMLTIRRIGKEEA